jgi:lipoprotein-releasing system ATP-binding protein
MIELVNVTKDYTEPEQGGTISVLRGISLKISSRQAMVIVGPSGSGKSTLLNIMGGLDHPTSGQVMFDGRDLARLNDTELARIRNQDIGFVFQLHHLLPQCTVLENVLVPTLAGRGERSVKAIQERAEHLLDSVGLQDRLSHRPGELSGGQRQRVAVARALINQPQLLLADEPTGALDEETSAGIADLLVKLNKTEGVALIVVTHSLKLAGRIGRIVELRGGTLNDGGVI